MKQYLKLEIWIDLFSLVAACLAAYCLTGTFIVTAVTYIIIRLVVYYMSNK